MKGLSSLLLHILVCVAILLHIFLFYLQVIQFSLSLPLCNQNLVATEVGVWVGSRYLPSVYIFSSPLPYLLSILSSPPCCLAYLSAHPHPTTSAVGLDAGPPTLRLCLVRARVDGPHPHKHQDLGYLPWWFMKDRYNGTSDSLPFIALLHQVEQVEGMSCKNITDNNLIVRTIEIKESSNLLIHPVVQSCLLLTPTTDTTSSSYFNLLEYILVLKPSQSPAFSQISGNAVNFISSGFHAVISAANYVQTELVKSSVMQTWLVKLQYLLPAPPSHLSHEDDQLPLTLRLWFFFSHKYIHRALACLTLLLIPGLLYKLWTGNLSDIRKLPFFSVYGTIIRYLVVTAVLLFLILKLLIIFHLIKPTYYETLNTTYFCLVFVVNTVYTIILILPLTVAWDPDNYRRASSERASPLTSSEVNLVVDKQQEAAQVEEVKGKTAKKLETAKPTTTTEFDAISKTDFKKILTPAPWIDKNHEDRGREKLKKPKYSAQEDVIIPSEVKKIERAYNLNKNDDDKMKKPKHFAEEAVIIPSEKKQIEGTHNAELPLGVASKGSARVESRDVEDVVYGSSSRLVSTDGAEVECVSEHVGQVRMMGDIELQIDGVRKRVDKSRMYVRQLVATDKVTEAGEGQQTTN